MGAKISPSNQTLNIREQNLRQGQGILQKQLHQAPLQSIDESKIHQTKNIRQQQGSMCDKIYENNRKGSIVRLNRRLKNYSSMNTTCQNKQNCDKIANKSEVNQKLKYLQNNKKLIEQSIEATVCVSTVLNILCHRQILRTDQFNYLNAKNRKSLQCKQKRYKNLEARQLKALHSIKISTHNQLIKRKPKLSETLHQCPKPIFPTIQRKPNMAQARR